MTSEGPFQPKTFYDSVILMKEMGWLLSSRCVNDGRCVFQALYSTTEQSPQGTP